MCAWIFWKIEKIHKKILAVNLISLTLESQLKRIEKKEVERAEANAILAAHYLKIG